MKKNQQELTVFFYRTSFNSFLHFLLVIVPYLLSEMIMHNL